MKKSPSVRRPAHPTRARRPRLSDRMIATCYRPPELCWDDLFIPDEPEVVNQCTIYYLIRR